MSVQDNGINYLTQSEDQFLIWGLGLRDLQENSKEWAREQVTRTNLEPQSRGCSNQTVWRVPYSLSLYANQIWEMVRTVNTQEASESQKFPWLLLTTVSIKNPPIPSLTPPSLPDCSQCASQFLITPTSSGCTYMGEEKTSMWEPLPRGSAFPSAQKAPLLGTFVISLLPRSQALQFPWTCRIPF